MSNIENGLTLHRYWDLASCRACAIKDRCTPNLSRRIARWEHEEVIDAVQRRLDANPNAMRVRRETVEHPFGTPESPHQGDAILMKTLPRVSGEMALHILAHNLTRVLNIMGSPHLLAAMQA